MLLRIATDGHPYEVLTYAGNHGYPDLLMKAGRKAVSHQPLDVLIYAAKGGHNDLVKVAQPCAINRDPIQVMNIANDLGTDGLGEAATRAAIQKKFSFQALEYATQNELHACMDDAANETLYCSLPTRLTEAAKWLSHRTLVAWVCT